MVLELKRLESRAEARYRSDNRTQSPRLKTGAKRSPLKRAELFLISSYDLS